MDSLWAPWRMQFIQEWRGKHDGCVFCEMLGADDDREQLILHRSRYSYVVLNRFPYNNGHMLIVPMKHVAELHDLTAEEHADVMKLLAVSVQALRSEIEAEGVNCGINLGKAAGAGIEDHIHIHAVPRWVGDTNFMPVMSGTRSMPEYLHETYDRLIGGFERLGGGK